MHCTSCHGVILVWEESFRCKRCSETFCGTCERWHSCQDDSDDNNKQYIPIVVNENSSPIRAPANLEYYIPVETQAKKLERQCRSTRCRIL
jgi:hypothetical protein